METLHTTIYIVISYYVLYVDALGNVKRCRHMHAAVYPDISLTNLK